MIPMPFVKVGAFIRRDFQIESSYKVAFLLQILSSVFPVFIFFFVAKLIDRGDSPELEKYGGDYFPFVLVGVAFSQYFLIALRSFATTIRRAQTTGVLEAILSTQTSPQAVILYTSAYSFLVSTIHVAIVFAVGGLVLGADFSRANLLSVSLILLLTIVTFGALGILSATLILILKKGDPIELLIGSSSTLLGGAMFPISVMPNWMQNIANFLPMTHSLEAMRLAVFRGDSIVDLWVPIAALGAMAVILLPASFWSFSRAVEKARREGTLIHY